MNSNRFNIYGVKLTDKFERKLHLFLLYQNAKQEWTIIPGMVDSEGLFRVVGVINKHAISQKESFRNQFALQRYHPYGKSPGFKKLAAKSGSVVLTDVGMHSLQTLYRSHMDNLWRIDRLIKNPEGDSLILQETLLFENIKKDAIFHGKREKIFWD